MFVCKFIKNMCGSGALINIYLIFGRNIETIRFCISAYFSGDGGVDGQAVTATTASKQLASDLLYALSRFGIWARSRRFLKGI